MNRYEVIGRLGKDPEVRHLESGSTVAQFTVATSEKYTDKSSGEVKEITDWHNVVLWGRYAEIAEKYLKKGDLARFMGKHSTRSWEKDGVTRYTSECVVNPGRGEMEMLGSKGDKGESAPPPTGDDLPF